MSGPISDRLFLDYLQCKYKAYLKLSGKSGTKNDYEKYLDGQAGIYRRSARQHFQQSSQITSYSETTIDSPIDEFLDGLDKKSRAKVVAYLSLLEEEGPNLKRPYADVVRGKIRELRIHYSSNQYRVLCFFHVRDEIVLVHAISKKTQQLKEKDIELSERRMEDWVRRFPVGGGV